MVENTHFRFSLLLREIDNIQHSDDVSSIALVMIQLDGLAEVNERFGYLGGDKVLEEFAGRIGSVARDEDSSFEINGTSFALLVRNPAHEGYAVLAAEKIAQLAADPVTIGSGRACVKARMGVSILPDSAASAEELLRQCELALSVARARDEDYAVYSPEFTKFGEAARHAWFEVEDALKRSELEVHFQPKINLRTGQPVGAEALVRWESPELGSVPPGVFIPGIEKSQSIRSLFWFVLNTALRNSSQWAKEIPGFSISVNMAAGNIDDPDLPEVVEGALAIWNFPAEQLTLEVTETAMMQDLGSSMLILNRLRGLGLRISIDDFGTGYSSLAGLKNIPADELKIDKSFIKPMATNDTDRRIVGAMIQLAGAVDFNIVAEGIEDAEAMQMLLAMGAETGQGFHFDAAMPAAEFEEKWISAYSRKRAESA
jgi:diguanylate cyclase (GGDEF)-like protein